MTKIFSNKVNDKTYFITDKEERKMLQMKDRNLHSEIRFNLAKTLGMTEFVNKFKEFTKMPYLTIEDSLRRYNLTKDFIGTIKSIFGKNAADYVVKFL